MASKKSDEASSSTSTVSCPICGKSFEKNVVEEHVNKCLFLNSSDNINSKRSSFHLNSVSPNEKRVKVENKAIPRNAPKAESTSSFAGSESKINLTKETIPLAERMRPLSLNDLVGQKQVFGPGSMLGSLLEQKKIPNMILWGPPGCGKTSLGNVVANICKEQNSMRFVKLSATMAGIGDVKEVVKVAKNEAQFKRHTVLFMDEIHRFNKLQQDTFLPHVENGTITLIGATTENPSFSLNNALLSRCRVVVLEKLSVDEVLCILKRALEKSKHAVVVCDGDARVALGALELAVMARDPRTELHVSGPAILSLEDIKDGIKRTHILYDRQGEQHYNTISAIHKSIRASDDNAALYWTTRALHGGEDPLYIARRLVRAACEDIDTQFNICDTQVHPSDGRQRGAVLDYESSAHSATPRQDSL
ncbi:Werner helicase interacting protein [Operophtera brumata]|uniref:Werner helicase interacting protein n=1 Tax=Operophtera brumata TaxID=104452 RepID=A0A0L7L436_OPEBR|nr:Werner helicase interacting protein [Operophtera brumata]